MLCTYALKSYAEQLNLLKLNDYGITPIEKFASTTTYITIKITTNVDVKFMS